MDWSSLTTEVLERVFVELIKGNDDAGNTIPATALAKCRRVCRHWRDVSSAGFLWRRLVLLHYTGLNSDDLDNGNGVAPPFDRDEPSIIGDVLTTDAGKFLASDVPLFWNQYLPGCGDGCEENTLILALERDWVRLYDECFEQFRRFNVLDDNVLRRSALVVAQLRRYLRLAGLSNVLNSLNDGLSDEELADCAGKWNIPLTVQCFWKFLGGQSISSLDDALLGAYSVYDYSGGVFLADPRMFPESRGHSRDKIPVALTLGCPGNPSRFRAQSIWQAFVEDRDGLPVEGAVGEEKAHAHDIVRFVRAPSLLSLLEAHASDLHRGNLVRGKASRISRFPRVDGCVSAVTNGVCVTVSPLFIMENTDFQAESPRYFMAYRITISMSETESPELECQLTNRNWEICSGPGARLERISGPGVVGHHPIAKPGSSFTYKSCSYFSTLSEECYMEGSFEFRSLKRPGVEFRARVPRFNLAASGIQVQRQSNLF